MSAALDAAREHYSEWFHPFPWELLKLSEFPAYAGYAQGFPTNITFSEGIGFLTKSDPRSHAAFAVVAHEAAHQWWANILTPGHGPGGNMLSEGMSHYATILLHEEVHGDRYRIEFAKRIEDSYGGRPFRELRAVPGQDRRFAAGRQHGHLRQGWLGDVDAPTGDGPGEPPGRTARLHRRVPRRFGFPGDPGHAGRPEGVRPGSQRPSTPSPPSGSSTWWRRSTGLSGVTKERAGRGWIVRGTVENAGTGRMTIDVAAAANERWSDAGDAGTRTVVSPSYRERPDVGGTGRRRVSRVRTRGGFRSRTGARGSGRPGTPTAPRGGRFRPSRVEEARPDGSEHPPR